MGDYKKIAKSIAKRRVRSELCNYTFFNADEIDINKLPIRLGDDEYFIVCFYISDNNYILLTTDRIFTCVNSRNDEYKLRDIIFPLNYFQAVKKVEVEEKEFIGDIITFKLKDGFLASEKVNIVVEHGAASSFVSAIEYIVNNRGKLTE